MDMDGWMDDMDDMVALEQLSSCPWSFVSEVTVYRI